MGVLGPKFVTEIVTDSGCNRSRNRSRFGTEFGHGCFLRRSPASGVSQPSSVRFGHQKSVRFGHATHACNAGVTEDHFQKGKKMPSEFNSTINSPRGQAWSKMLSAAAHAALADGILTTDPASAVESQEFRFECGGVPMVAHVDGIGYGEVGVSVLAWPNDRAHRELTRGRTSTGAWLACIERDWRRYGDAWARGWIERKTAFGLQRCVTWRGRRGAAEHLADLPGPPLPSVRFWA